MSGPLSVNNLQKSQNNLTLDPLPQKTEAPKEGQDGGRKVSALIQKFESSSVEVPKSKGPQTGKQVPVKTRERTITLVEAPKGQKAVKVSLGPKDEPKPTPSTTSTTPSKYNYKEYVQKFGSKTANLYEIENLGVKVPERSPISSKEIFDHILSEDTEGVIQKSWEAMKQNKEIDDTNLKAITDKISEILDKGFPFTKEQEKWITETMAGKVLIARSTGDEDSADTPNAGGNESVLFVEPTTASVSKAMKEVVLSYFGSDSLRNRVVGDGKEKVLEGLPKMPVLLMEMISEPIKVIGKDQPPTTPPIGIAMSTDKVEFTGGEDFHFVSISSAVGPGVNEGSGRIEVDETFVMQSKDGTPLLIYQQPSIKEERIRAVKDSNGKISSQMEKNSTETAYSPSLSRDQVRSLVTSTDKIKTLNGGKTTEVEGVVGGDKQINFVQHRPIPDSQSKVEPTYVSTTQSEGHTKTFGYTTVVPKSGDALVITDWSQVCFAETMKEAESLFDWTRGTQKIVIVRQPDCSNSHPAVNFGSYKKLNEKGEKEPNPIPCLVVPNYNELMALKEKSTLSGTKPFVIDGQTQTAFLWTDDTFNKDTAISEGRISHHIGLETGVKQKGVSELISKLKTTPSGEIGKLKGELEPILTHYEQEIAKLEKRLSDGKDTIYNAEGLGYQLKTTKENFKAVKEAFAQVIAGNEKYTFDEGTHARLLLVKFLEASLHDVEGFPGVIDAGISATKYLQAMKGSPVDKPVFGDEVNTVKQGLTGPLAMRWKRFLALAEQSGLSEKEIAGFKGMMANLDKMGVTANWMSTVFDKMYGEILPPRDQTGKTSAVPKAKELLLALLNDYEETGPFLEKQEALQKRLDEAERSVSDFATPSKFEKAFTTLKGLAQTLMDEPWPDDLNSKPLKKAVQIETLGRLIEVYDSSIKALKGSDLPTDKLLKTELEMLDTFKALHENLFMKIKLPGFGQTPLGKSKFIGGLNKAFTSIKEQVAQEKDLKKLEAQSRCGKDFNVQACLSGNGAKEIPGNVEEMFTTLHQSLEAIRSGLMVGGSDYSIDTPKDLQRLVSAIPRLAIQTAMKVPPILVGRDITSTGVTYIYNMPVLDHGIKIRAHYEKPTTDFPQGKTTLEIDFYAANSGGRLKGMAKLAQQSGIGDDIAWGANLMKARFEVRTDKDIQKMGKLINEICAYSVAPRSDVETNRNFENLQTTIDVANDPTSGLFPVKRERILNDVLNVAFGTVGSKTDKTGAISYTSKDYHIHLTPSKDPFPFTDSDGNTHNLKLNKPFLGLQEDVYMINVDQLRAHVSDEVLQGTHKFTFSYKGKTYALDLNQPNLGLSPKDLKVLSLSPKNLASLQDHLSQAWDNATFHFLDENTRGPTQYESNWIEVVYGAPMPSSKHSKMPELDLWKSVSGGGRSRGDLAPVDKAFERALQKKYALQEIEARLSDQGTFMDPKDKIALNKALQDYYKELAKCEITCAGYMGNIWRNSKISVTPSNIHGKVRSLGEQTMIERRALQNRLQLLGLEPDRPTREEITALPFNEHHGKFTGLQGQDFLPDGPITRL